MNPHTTRFSIPLGLLLVQLLALLLLALVTGCHGSVTVHGPPPPAPPPPPPVYWEGEPNDTAWQAPWFGTVFPGDVIYVSGHMTDNGSDPQDGLAFTGNGPCRIDFTLYVDDPWTDLDVWLFDPYLNAFVAAYESSWGDESGTFWLDGPNEFHLVVVSYEGASNYTLAVSASGTAYAALDVGEWPELPEGLRDYAEEPAPEHSARD